MQRDYRDIDDIVRMCRRRIRVPDQWFGDYLAAIGAARIGERRLKAFIDKYGAKAVRAFIGEWLDYSERRARESIRTLPSRRLENEGCHDPIQPFLPDGIPIKVTIDIDSRRRVHHRGPARQPRLRRRRHEPHPRHLDHGGGQAVFACLDPDIPHNAGSFRRLEVLLRENCVVGIPRFPHSCSVATTNMTDMIINLIQSAFATLGDGYGFSQGNFCNGAGTGVCSGKDWRRDGAPYVNQMFMSAGGMAASAETDGMHGLVNPVSVGLVYRDSIEVNEQRFPFQVDSVRALVDSCGAGRRRGGPASEVIFGPRHDPMLVINICNGLTILPQGVRGGLPSQAGYQAKIAADGTREVYETDAYCHLEPGSRLHAIDNGGGGYGDPLEREPARVLDDVNERYVSRAKAAALYGVVIVGSEEDDDLAIDVAATEALRRERKGTSPQVG